VRVSVVVIIWAPSLGLAVLALLCFERLVEQVPDVRLSGDERVAGLVGALDHLGGDSDWECFGLGHASMASTR
jgi:hypothetical protein